MHARALFRCFAALVLGIGLAVPAIAAKTAPPASAITAVRYELTIDGHSLASFSELVTIASAAAGSGSEGGATVTVVLRRPMTRNIEIAAWHELVILGDVAAARKNVSITAYDSAGAPVARYHLTDAWPQKIEIGALKAGASEVLLETVTMTCEFIQRVSV